MSAARPWLAGRRLARLAPPLLAVLLAAALLLLSLRAGEYDASRHFEHVALLRQIKQLDARWELDVMKSRMGIDQTYDALTGPLDDLYRLPRQLNAMALPAGHGDAAALAASVAAFQRALADKTAAVEAFKSHNAVLRNSLAFLPSAVAEIGQQPGAQRAAAAANAVLLATLLMEQESPDVRAGTIHPMLAALEARRAHLPAEAGLRIGIFTAHVRTVLREHQAVNRLLERVAGVPTAQRIDDISALLGGAQQRAALASQRHRAYLLLLASALAGLLLYAAASLLRSHATINRVNGELQRANDNLESRVRQRTEELVRMNQALQDEIAERKQLQVRLIQSEKLASVGSLAAGVAHEINNPLGFLASNFSMLEQYTAQLFEMLAAHEEEECGLAAPAAARLRTLRAQLDLAYLREDIPVLLAESKGGMQRVSKIVQDLRDFSCVDKEHSWQLADLHRGIDSTLNLMAGEIRPVAEVCTEYGAVPHIECQPLQLNQVIMSLLLNAARAIGPERGRITVRTGADERQAWLEVADTGCGIPEETLPRIFDPFFTTRAVGQGSGLGLSLSYGIVQNHQGRIEVQTAVGGGSAFRVILPLRQREARAA